MLKFIASRRIVVGLLTAPGWMQASAHTWPMTVDKTVTGAQPVVGVSQGVPIIQIVPPSVGGVSHNRFTHFNVGPTGAVLNNSGGTSQTGLAGQIAGNPMLGNRCAGIILNEVTAPNVSQLRGMLEVAGHRAHVIVANPAGITCNGCGFLNASRATLTTGRAEVGPKGNISLAVAAGKLHIDGDGLNGTDVGQLDLLARALVLNAGVWTDRLNVVAGSSRVDAVSGQTTALDGKGPKPTFALDTAALGGMYANSIRLVGTESGVGVNVGGNLVALTGDLTLNAAGDIRVAPNGTLSAKQKLTVHTPGHLDTRQATLHAHHLDLAAQSLRNQKGSITSANTATLRLKAEIHNAGGTIAATGKNHVEASQLNNLGGTLAGGNLNVAIQNGVDNRNGLIFADQALQMTASRLVNQDTFNANPATTSTVPVATLSQGATGPSSTGVSAKTVTIKVAQVDNTKGMIQASGDLTLTADDLKNPSGLIASQRNVRIDAGTLNNRGGTFSAAQQLTANVQQFTSLGWLQSGGDLVFSYPGPLTPLGNFIAGRDLKLEVGGAFVNKGRLTAGRDLLLTAASLNNTATGEILGGRHTTLTLANNADNAGLIDGQYTRVNASQINNRGRIFGDSVTLTADTLVNDAGSKGSALIASRGNLKLGVGTLTNRHHSVLYAKAHLRLGRSVNPAGQVTGQSDHVQNTSATIEAGSSIIIEANQIHNQNADFVSETVEVSSKPKVYFTPEGSTEMYDAATNWLCDKVTRACSHNPQWLEDDPERGFLLPSKKYPASRYGPLFDYAPYTRGAAGFNTPIALSYTPPRQARYATHAYFRYPRDSRIWSVFGVPPPDQELPTRNEREPTLKEKLKKGYKPPLPYEERPEYLNYKTRHQQLDGRIKAFNQDFQKRLIKSFTFYEVKEVVTHTRTVRSDPGRIFSAGILSLKGVVTNEKSQIAAGGKLSVQGPQINNIGATGWRTITREGQATFTQARSGDRKAHRSPYHVTVRKEPFDLPVGAVRTVMAPKVHVPTRPDTNQMYGTLMAGRNTYLASSGTIINSGTVGAREALQISAANIVNHSGGHIQARRLDLVARESLTNLAAQIQGAAVSLRAGHNINLLSTGASEDHGSTRGTYQTGTSRVTANDLTMQAGNDIDMLAAQVTVERDARIQAGRDIRLQALAAHHNEVISSGAHQRHEITTQKVIGSVANAKRDLALAAGQDVSAAAATLNAQQNLTVDAGRDVSIKAGVDSGAVTDQYREKKKGLVSSKTESTDLSGNWQQSHATTVTGANIAITAGRNVNVEGSNVGAQSNLDIAANGNVAIGPGRNQRKVNHVEKMKKSGVGATGGMSVGRSHQIRTMQEDKVEHTPSTLGSVTGDASIRAAKAINVTASRILAPKGNLDITGSEVNIGAVHDIHRRKESLDVKQKGVTVGVSTPVLDMASAVDRLSNAAGKTDSPLIQGLAAAAAGIEAADTLAILKKQGGAAGAVDKVGGARINVQIGANRQSSKTVAEVSAAAGSTVAADKNLTVDARGDSNKADINVVGSTLTAHGDVALKADGKINLQASQDTIDMKRTSKGSSAAVGVGASLGSGGASLGAQVNAKAQKGQARGQEKRIINTKVVAGKKTTLQSGGDTHLQGAVARGHKVVTKVGGNLQVASAQDTSSYKSKDQSVGAGVTIGAGVSGSANTAKNHVKGDFATVREQSGIQAGDGGFDVTVKGHTDLKGAAIASSDKAVKAGLNRLATGSISVSDIENHNRYKATGSALGASGSIGVGGDAGVAPGLSKTSGSESSTTRSGVSGASVTIADHEAQRKLTGQTAEQLLATLNLAIRTGDGAGGLSKTWDPEKLRTKVAAEAEIISTFTNQVSQTIRTYTDEKRNALREQINKSEGTDAEALQQQINALNTQERIMNVVVGVLTGSGGIAAVHAGLSEAADQMRQYTIADSKKFRGITDGVTTLDNFSGESAGIRGDGFNTAGVRIDLDILCGTVNERCKTELNTRGEKRLDSRGVPMLALNHDGFVEFDTKESGHSLENYLRTKNGQEMRGFTGGIQGRKSTFAGMEYSTGSIFDLVHEAYGGSHDFIGGTLTNLYDESGNAQRGRTSLQKNVHEVLSAAALAPATPFALSEILSKEAWQALDILLRLKK